MRFSAIFHLLGRLLVIVGASMCVPAAVSHYYAEVRMAIIFSISAVITLVIGIGLMLILFKAREAAIAIREGF